MQGRVTADCVETRKLSRPGELLGSAADGLPCLPPSPPATPPTTNPSIVLSTAATVRCEGAWKEPGTAGFADLKKRLLLVNPAAMADADKE